MGLCARALSGLPCPGADGKLCDGHANNNPDDKASYIAYQLPRVQEKIRYWKEREAALLKSQQQYPQKKREGGYDQKKHLHALEFEGPEQDTTTETPPECAVAGRRGCQCD